MRRHAPIFAANWKMHHGPSAARTFVRTFLERHAADAAGSVILFPSAVSLDAVHRELRDRPDIGLGVQNIWTEDAGAFTGETSAPMAREAGASYALVGHSERRHVFGEADATTALKCAAAARAGLTPVLCVGELLLERERGATLDVVRRQLKAGLSKLTPEQIAASAIAYEPVWAIGTGRTATPDDACAVHQALRTELAELAGDAAGEIAILYGGSVTPENAAALLAAPNVDGLLVGGASLDPHSWERICACAALKPASP